MAATNNTNTLFEITEYIKANSTIQRNVDSDFLRPFINLSMDKWCLPELGTSLFLKLQNDIQNNTLSGDYQTLLTVYVQPMLLWFVQTEAIGYSSIQFTNKGPQVKKSDYSDAPKSDDLQRVEKKMMENAEYYAQRCSNYLRANILLFPEYMMAGTGIDTIFPNATSYSPSVTIPRRLRAGILDSAEDYGY